MLSSKAFEEWCCINKISESAQKLIQNIRQSPPYRSVGGGKRNVYGKYPSTKMGVTIQFESHKVELPGIYQMEYDKDVLEYYDQPFPIKLVYISGKGKNVGVMSTPDFFVIRKDSASWEEWKTEEELIKLSKQSPNRYLKDENGIWRCPPGEEYAKSFGLDYKLRSDSEIDWMQYRNIKFMEDYFIDSKTMISEDIKEKVKKQVEETPGITLADLIHNVGAYSADDIYYLLARNEIYTDIRKTCLTYTEDVPLFISKDHACAMAYFESCKVVGEISTNIIETKVGNRILWDSKVWVILNVGDNAITLLTENQSAIDLPRLVFELYINQGKIVNIANKANQENETAYNKAYEIIKNANQRDLEIANYRYGYIQIKMNNDKIDKADVPLRTIRLWMQNYKKAEVLYNNGFVGLIPLHHNKGNKNKRLPDEADQLMHDYIENRHEAYQEKTRAFVYRELADECEKKGILLPSYKTFCKAIGNRLTEKAARKRLGNRAAYKYESFYLELEETTPRHGERAFEYAHIDHTELDSELIDSITFKNLGRPYLTLMIDAYTRRILAFFLTFDSPSYRSIMMVMRECVRRHNRLPSTIIVDGGKEFQSTYFESLLAMYNITKKVRPPAKAKFGSVIERLFGTTNKMFIHNLTGNTQIMKNVRQVTKSVNPKHNAIWDIKNLQLSIEEWAYEIYDTKNHPALDESPKESFIRSVKISGERPIRYIAYDFLFQILTLPSTKKGCAKVHCGAGIKINYIYYWSESMKNPEVENKTVPVRYDPYNAGIAYAYIKNEWVRCISQYYSFFNGKSEKEIRLITNEIAENKRINNKISNITAKEIVQFGQKIGQIEAILSQRKKDFEERKNDRSLENIRKNDELKKHKEVKQDNEMKNDEFITEEKLDLYGDF